MADSAVPNSRPKRRLPRWTHPAQYASARLVMAGVNVLGFDAALDAALAAGRRFGRLPSNRTRVRRAMDNINWCFPQWSQHRVERCAIDAYGHLFALGAEFALAPRMMSRGGWTRWVRFGDLGPALNLLMDDRPCLLITGHCGNWELQGATLGRIGFPIHAVYRALDVKPLDRWVQRTRSEFGVRLVDKFGGAEALRQALRGNGSVAFIADQNAGKKGLFVPFFDRLTSTYKSIGLLALSNEAPIICGHTRRLRPAEPSDHRYQLDVTDVIMPEEWSSAPDPLFYITARYRRAIERMVSAAPEQYLWMHRYWKTRPRHEMKGRPFPGALRDKLEQLPWMTPERLARVIERSRRDAAEIAAGASTLPGGA